MLPTDRFLTKAEIEQVALDFSRWLSETGSTILSVSKTLGDGFSAPVLSQFKSGQYRGDVETVARTINQFIERKTRAKEVVRPNGFVETAVAKRILTTARMVIDGLHMGYVYGPSGTGKSMTAEAIRRAYTGSIYIRVVQSTRRGPGFIKAIARQLGLSAKTAFEQSQLMLIEHLHESGRPLLVDEAHQLADSGFEAIRDLHDAAKLPVLMFGTYKLNELLTDTDKHRGQFSSRSVIRCDITEAASRPKNPRPLFTVDEIQELFTSDRLRLTDDGAQFLAELACLQGFGGLRICAAVIRVAASIPDLKGKAVSAKHLISIVRQMHGETYMQLVSNRNEQLLARKVG